MVKRSERVKAGMPAALEDIRFDVACARWILHRKKTSDYWMQDEAKMRKAFVEPLGPKSVREVTKTDCEAALHSARLELGLKGSTFNRYRTCLHTFFEYLIEQGYREVNPVSKVEVMVEQKRGAHIPNELVKAYVEEARLYGYFNADLVLEQLKEKNHSTEILAPMLGVAPERVNYQLRKFIPTGAQVRMVATLLGREPVELVDRSECLWFFPFIVFAMNAGPRAGELLAFYWRDFIPSLRRLEISRRYQSQLKREKEGTKGGAGRVIPLNDYTIRVLEEFRLATPFRGQDDLIFHRKDGSRVSPSTLAKIHRRIARAVGLSDSVRPYDITRHKFASEITKRFGLRAAQALLGHSTADLTERYAHDDPDHLINQAVQVEVGNNRDPNTEG